MRARCTHTRGIVHQRREDLPLRKLAESLGMLRLGRARRLGRLGRMGRVRSLSVLGGMDGEGRLSRLQMLGRGMRLLLHQPWLSGGRVLKVLRGYG